MDFHHVPVMVDEIVDFLGAAPEGTYVDATLGGGGHAAALLTARADFTLVGIDRDPRARAAAATRLERFGERVHIVAGRFDDIGRIVAGQPVPPVTAVLFDLGVSSPQFDDPARGFSYRHDAPLDMRMNPADEVSAADIVNAWEHPELTRLLRDGADERFASRIAARIIDHRPIETTGELAAVVTDAIPAATRRRGGHPAKRTFQALRIAVNDELMQITPALADTIELLAPGGRAAILSYHSGEDRLVKAAIGDAEAGGCTCPPRLPCVCDDVAPVTSMRPRSLTASQAEIDANPRASSARMRGFIRTERADGAIAEAGS